MTDRTVKEITEELDKVLFALNEYPNDPCLRAVRLKLDHELHAAKWRERRDKRKK